MGALFSLIETLLYGESDWVESGIRNGYFALHKHWERSDVHHAKQLLTTATSLRLSGVSLVGQTFDEGVLEELLQLCVAREELEILRLVGGTEQLVDAIVAQHRPAAAKRLRVEYHLDDNVAAYWRDLSLLPTRNVLVLAALDN